MVVKYGCMGSAQEFSWLASLGSFNPKRVSLTCLGQRAEPEGISPVAAILLDTWIVAFLRF